MSRLAALGVAALLSVLASGCSSIRAPQYSPSIPNVSQLKAAPVSARVGEFQTSADKSQNPNPIGLRAASMSSPYQDSYSQYLAAAIKSELELAGKLDPQSQIEISGQLNKNKMDASGLNTGEGDIAARFVVKKADVVVYDQVKTAHIEWESSFAGAIAIPAAVQAYPDLVTKLLETLYADKNFMDALK